jgi:hypothetical protein
MNGNGTTTWDSKESSTNQRITSRLETCQPACAWPSSATVPSGVSPTGPLGTAGTLSTARDANRRLVDIFRPTISQHPVFGTWPILNELSRHGRHLLQEWNNTDRAFFFGGGGLVISEKGPLLSLGFLLLLCAPDIAYHAVLNIEKRENNQSPSHRPRKRRSVWW